MTQTVQVRFEKECKLNKPYSYGAYNKVKGDKQAIRLTEGCVHNCAWCYEPTTIKLFGIPLIECNHVLIYDMNLLCKPIALQFIETLGKTKVNDKVVKYELVCGIDYRFLTQEIANALHKNRFVKIRYAWDSSFSDQKRVKKGLDILLKAGYKRKDIMVFMVCNYRITVTECDRKLDLLKVWNVKACDCYYDGQVMPHVIPMFWSMDEIKFFRAKVRKHNQIVNFGIDPEAR
jgi:hypothetical protein